MYVRNLSSHDVDLDTGAMLPPGGRAVIDESERHLALIDEGLLETIDEAPPAEPVEPPTPPAVAESPVPIVLPTSEPGLITEPPPPVEVEDESQETPEQVAAEGEAQAPEPAPEHKTDEPTQPSPTPRDDTTTAAPAAPQQ